MRLLFLLTSCFFLLPFTLQAQLNDLSEMSQGEFINFQALFDNDDHLFGYVAQFGLGETEKRVNTFEFVVYDKNLNRLLVEQVTGDNLVDKFYFELNKNQELIISANLDLGSIGLMKALKLGNREQIKNKKLDVKTGVLTEVNTPCYFAGELMDDCLSMTSKEMGKKMKAHKKEIGFFEQGLANELNDNKFLVLTRRTKNYQQFTDFQIKLFDENKRELWSYEYNVKAKTNQYEEVQILDYSEDKLSFFQKNVDKKKVELLFKVTDAKTGKIIAEQTVEGLSEDALKHLLSSKANLMKRSNDAHTLFSAAVIEDKRRVKGIFVAQLNNTTNQLQYEIIDFNEDLASFIDEEIHQRGSIDGHHLYPRDILLKEDGSFKLIGELTKYDFETGRLTVESVKDLYVLDFTQEMQLNQVEVIEKSKRKQKRPNYLFSQNLEDDSDDLVFFYRDFVKNEETGDENWILYINTYKNNELIQDQLKLTSTNDGYEIYPFFAKNGYILLHEFNEKEEHNQIRLERLNVN